MRRVKDHIPKIVVTSLKALLTAGNVKPEDSIWNVYYTKHRRFSIKKILWSYQRESVRKRYKVERYRNESLAWVPNKRSDTRTYMYVMLTLIQNKCFILCMNYFIMKSRSGATSSLSRSLISFFNIVFLIRRPSETNDTLRKHVLALSALFLLMAWCR